MCLLFSYLLLSTLIVFGRKHNHAPYCTAYIHSSLKRPLVLTSASDFSDTRSGVITSGACLFLFQHQQRSSLSSTNVYPTYNTLAKQTMAVMTLEGIVHNAVSADVFKVFSPTREWSAGLQYKAFCRVRMHPPSTKLFPYQET